MTYEKLDSIILYMRAMQEKEFDIILNCTAPKGFGKSSGNIQMALKYLKTFGLTCTSCKHEWVYTGKAIIHSGSGMQLRQDMFQPCPKCSSHSVQRVNNIDFMRYLAYDNDDVRDKVYDLPMFSPILADEGVRFMMGEDWMRSESKEMKKLFAQMRTKGMIVLTNIQRFKWTDSKYRNDMTTFWVRILKRGLAILMQPDLGEKDDPWDLKLFDKLLGSYFYFTSDRELEKKAEKIVNKHPCAFDWFYIPKVPEELYQRYKAARDKKVFERKKQVESIDQREIAKIVAYNLTERWDQIMGAIKMSRFKKPTFKILEEFVFSHPESSDNIIRYTTIRNWIRDIDKVVKAK